MTLLPTFYEAINYAYTYFPKESTMKTKIHAFIGSLLFCLLIAPNLICAADMGSKLSKAKQDQQNLDFRKAKVRADKGDLPAQFALGQMYREGKGVKADDGMALKYFRAAADQGHIKAQAKVGAFYLHGIGTKENPSEAAQWFGKAAAKGHVDSMVNLAMLCQSGRGVKQDMPLAMSWYRQAAEKGHIGAQYMLGVLYSGGPSRNLKEAQIWYKKAAGKGHPGAREALKQPKSAKNADNKVQKIIIAPANPPKI